MLDTSCACLMRVAGKVHDEGFKVALTGEGADEALAGYVWFRSQKIGRLFGHIWPFLPSLVQQAVLASIGGDSASCR